MGLSELREFALTYQATRTVRYPVCLDTELRDQLRLVQGAQLKAATDAAYIEAHPAPEQAPRRRTLGDRENAVTLHIKDLEAKATELLAKAEAADRLLVLVFGIPEAAQDDPAGFYEGVAAAYDGAAGGRSVNQRQVMRELTVASYLRAESPKGDDLTLTYEQVAKRLLNHADLETLDAMVLNLYREPGTVPFDPATSGQQT